MKGNESSAEMNSAEAAGTAKAEGANQPGKEGFTV